MLPKILYGLAALVILSNITILAFLLSGMITVADSAMTRFYVFISLGFISSFAAIVVGRYLQNQDSAEITATTA